MDKSPDIYEGVSLETLERLDRFLRFGYYPGDAMGSVLENNLSRFANSADDSLWRELRPLCRYLYNRVPAVAWGSREAVSKWIHYTNDYRADALAGSSHNDYIASRRAKEGL